MNRQNAPVLTDDELLRYSRQLNLEKIGFEGQHRIASAKILVVGAGGLGGLVCLYLVAAGVEHLDICDHDVVNLTNLNRQIQFDTQQVGSMKAQSTRERCTALNAKAQIHTISETIQSYLSTFADTLAYDLVLDCSDNFAARYTIAKFCSQYATPLISAAIQKFNAQLIALNSSESSACYGCIFPPSNDKEWKTDTADRCSEMGILGASVGIIASMQAQCALLYLSGSELPGDQSLQLLDLTTMNNRRFTARKDPKCAICAAGKE